LRANQPTFCGTVRDDISGACSNRIAVLADVNGLKKLDKPGVEPVVAGRIVGLWHRCSFRIGPEPEGGVVELASSSGPGLNCATCKSAQLPDTANVHPHTAGGKSPQVSGHENGRVT